MEMAKFMGGQGHLCQYLHVQAVYFIYQGVYLVYGMNREILKYGVGYGYTDFLLLHH